MDITLPTQIDLQVVTPERVAVSAAVTAVSLPGASGRLGILPGHAPLVSELAAGVLFYEQNGLNHYLAVSQGFAEVLQGRVIVLTQTAERAEDIDLGRAQIAKRQAEDLLKKSAGLPAEGKAAQAALDQAAARIDAVSQAKRA